MDLIRAVEELCELVGTAESDMVVCPKCLRPSTIEQLDNNTIKHCGQAILRFRGSVGGRFFYYCPCCNNQSYNDEFKVIRKVDRSPLT